MKNPVKMPSGAPQVPEAVQNVYRDMRDRHLLWVAGALLIAIVAVPFLLAGGSGPAPPPQTDVKLIEAGAAAQTEPVVFADVPGLRNYHERLDRYRSRNPFKQQLTGTAGEGTGGGSGNGGEGGNLPTAEDVASAPASSADTAAPSSSGLDASSPSVPSAEPTPSDETGSGDDSDDRDKALLITYRVDVRVGPVGETEVRRDVESIEFLPSRRVPVVQYVNSDVHGKAASFILNPDATALKGDARCYPDRARCRFLRLRPGDDQLFRYEPQGRTYRLELLAINRHAEPADRDGGSKRSDG